MNYESLRNDNHSGKIFRGHSTLSELEPLSYVRCLVAVTLTDITLLLLLLLLLLYLFKTRDKLHYIPCSRFKLIQTIL
jgi:hypothetical protein